MEHARVINRRMPERSFVMRMGWPRMIWEVRDLTQLSEQELNQVKVETVNYATTEAAGKYYMLVLADIIDKDLDPETPDLAEKMTEMFLQASDWWNAHIIQTQN